MTGRATAVLALAALLTLAFCAGCTQRARPAQSARSNPYLSVTGPDWAVRDAALFRADPSAYASAAASMLTPGEQDPDFEPWSFATLPPALSRLSNRGTVWVVLNANTSDCVFFDNGLSDYPCADGLIYSSSPTLPPDADSVLTTPTPVAAHWWVATWDPALFYAFSYGNPDADPPGNQLVFLTNPRRLSAPSVTITGTVVAEMSGLTPSNDLVEYLNTGGTKPTPIVLNSFTKLHWPKSWGRYVAPRGEDPPTVQLPLHAPDSFTGVRVVATVRTTVLPNGRKQAFALEVWFGGR